MVTMKPTYRYYFSNMQCSLDIAIKLTPCKAKLIFVKSDIYIYYIYLIKILNNP